LTSRNRTSAIVTSSSLRMISSTRVTPFSPSRPGRREKRGDQGAARASASALSTSWRSARAVDSTSFGRPPRDHFGQRRIDDAVPSSCRPPWLETPIGRAPL